MTADERPIAEVVRDGRTALAFVSSRTNRQLLHAALARLEAALKAEREAADAMCLGMNKFRDSLMFALAVFRRFQDPHTQSVTVTNELAHPFIRSAIEAEREWLALCAAHDARRAAEMTSPREGE